MGAFVGLMGGIGLLLVLLAWTTTPAVPVEENPADDVGQAGRNRLRRRLRELMADAGVEAVGPGALLASSMLAAALVGLIFLVVSQTWPVALAFAVVAGYAPIALLRSRARRRRAELRLLWPDVVDNLASSVRAGRSLPDAIAQLGERGPEPLRSPFQRFGEDYRVSGRFHDSLDALKHRLADPTGDRIVESLRIARDVGGTDLGRLLRTLAAFLRDEARSRSELETRQGWVVNAARLAVASPWLLLALLSLRTTAIHAFAAPAGIAVLAGGLGCSVFAYQLMLRLGRLPEDERVLR